ncbi:hypothetical protein NG895_28475 [Aeoliella sp. ICT_H6.2]|uniref:Uncharacterized protein n=1 Tax=Aeoliella straminimaris TaxID=2954799 RepID=A0A9X2JJ69_9BACT|nr:hypothetical protein [Aeoliella straminimaris]MCO6047860.1 hypothetical protein [Aeoliella straminimaris]
MNLNEVAYVLKNRPIGPCGFVEFYAPTWQCSHVRFVRGLWDADDYSREDALAWILQRGDGAYKENWIESISCSRCEAVPLREIASSIDALAKEIEESDHLANPVPLPIKSSDLDAASMPVRIQGLALYDYGPTAVYVWQRQAEFNYLEIHYES